MSDAQLFRKIRNQSGFNVLNSEQMTMVHKMLDRKMGLEVIVTNLRKRRESRWTNV